MKTLGQKVILLMLGLFTGTLLMAVDPGHEDDPPNTPPINLGRPGSKSGSRPGAPAGCGVTSGVLTQFATGERYDLHSMVTFLTQPECIENSRSIAASEMATEGIHFTATEPLNIVGLTKSLSPRDYDSLRKLDTQIAKSFPIAYRSNPIGQNDLLPLVGQLSLLSPAAARYGMVKLMEQEIMAADPVLGSESLSLSEKKRSAKELALNLVRLGANEPVLISEFANNVEELAVLAQADSLSKVFRGLAMATEFEPTLVPTFNAGAGAFSRGVQKSNSLFGKSEKGSLLKAAFSAVASSLFGNERLEPGASDLNDAIGLLMDGKPIQETTLKKIWREILRVLAVTPSQTQLAEALALSLTPDMAFLPDVERKLMLEAALNYPVVGFSVQTHSLIAGKALKDEVQRGSISTQKYNDVKSRQLVPLVAQILTWDALRISPVWIRGMYALGLVAESDLEKKFPRLTLTMFDAWDEAFKGLSETSRMESWIAASARGFMIHWTLNQAHIPALTKWVKKFEEQTSEGEGQ